ncbi:MAG: T9SS C-terminal target domain-containing protein [Saprospirales bacterium]|nr:MAG: T9SS C-terminal target domain-containing protein [Saprospirales bacterium]
MQAQDCIDIEQIKTDLSNIQDKCSCADPLVLGEEDQVVEISTYQLGPLVENECIEVFGTLVIDHGIRFENCDFIMDAGALIRTQSMFSPISFIECNLQSCGDYFWDGIELGWLNTLFFRGNTMQHALNGIHSEYAPVHCFINDNIFNNNRYAISLEDITQVEFRRSELTLNGNIFSQNDELKLHWDESPRPIHGESYGVRTYFAIVNSLVDSDPCSRTNIFIGLIRGYELRNSVSQIHSDLFYEFRRPEKPQAGAFEGTGIFSETIFGKVGSSSLVQTGWPTSDIETFSSVGTAIETIETFSDIRNNIIDDAHMGLGLNSPLARYHIEGNEIQVTNGPGIYNLSFISSYGTIKNNKITVEIDDEVNLYSLSGGILVEGIRPNNGFRSHIRNNSIDLNSGHYGIKTIGNFTNRNNISCNIVNIMELIEDFNYASGIEIIGGFQNLLDGNIVNGLYSTSTIDEVNGIKIVQSQVNNLVSNYVNNTQFGLHFSNWNSNTLQDENIMSNHDVGYYISESGITGDQYFVRNRWLGSYEDWGAENKGNVELSKYYDFQNLQMTNCWPSSISPDPGWFDPVQGQGNCWSSSIYECLDEDEPELSSLTSVDTLVARGELEFDDFEDSRIWQAERYLLRNLIDFPGLVGGSGTLMDSFLTNATSSSLWEYHKLQDQIEEFSSIPETLSVEWEANYTYYEDLMEDLEIAVNNWLGEPDSMNLIDEISLIYEEIDSIWNLNSAAFQHWRQESINNLSALLPDIALLSEPNLYAVNEKLIMEATVRMAQGLDSISTSLRSSLIVLSESCLLEHGPAVIDAKVLVKQLDYFPDMLELNCTESEGDRRIGQERFSPDLFKVFPNPGSGPIYLRLNSSIDGAGKVVIFDQSGRLVYNGEIDSAEEIKEIQVNHFSPGQYIIKVNVKGKEDTQSLIITK